MGKQYWKAGNMLYPLPAVLVTVKNKGKINAITVAWTGTTCSDPAMLFISVRKERYSYQMLLESKEFVVNLTTEDLCFATDYCGVKSGRDEDKLETCGLHVMDSKYVSAPSIVESPVNIECQVVSTTDLGTHTMFLAKVLGVTVDDKYLDQNGRFNLDEAKPLVYSHGQYYSVGKRIGKFGYSIQKKKGK